jgi:hypothetical protein
MFPTMKYQALAVMSRQYYSILPMQGSHLDCFDSRSTKLLSLPSSDVGGGPYQLSNSQTVLQTLVHCEQSFLYGYNPACLSSALP